MSGLFGLVAWRLSLVELAACPPIHSLYSLPLLYSNPVAFRKKHSYEVHQPSFCLCGHNVSFILRALKKDTLGSGRAPSVQHRHSGALSVLSVWQSAHAIKQHSLLPLSILQPVKGCILRVLFTLSPKFKWMASLQNSLASIIDVIFVRCAY